jgi:hypothetical protein
VTAKDKVTGEKTETTVEMPASVRKDGANVFPDGKAFNHKHAMSLSKSYWVAKTKAGTRQDLYEAFEKQYVAPVRGAASAATSDAEEAEDAEDAEAEPEVQSAAAAPAPAPAPAPKAKKVAAKKPKKVDEWVAPEDGQFAPWTFEGKSLFRNKENYVTGVDADGQDEWVGRFNPKTNEIEECEMPADFSA